MVGAGAVYAIVTEAARLPPAEGVKVMLIVQLELAKSEPPLYGQGLLPAVRAKSPELLPVTVMLVMGKGTLPMFVRVTACAGVLVVLRAWLAKVTVVAVRLGSEPVPVPVRVTDWGLPGALSVMVIVADSAPISEGLKVTLIVQLLPAVTELPHVLV